MSNIDEERGLYEDHLKWMMIEENTLEKARSDGRKEAREEGREEGEAKRNIEIAKILLEAGIAVDTIAQSTGLSISEIKKL